jgi:hypothetical protein
MATNRQTVDRRADGIVNSAREAPTPGDGFSGEVKAAIYDVQSSLDQIEGEAAGPDRSRDIMGVRAKLDQIRQYDPHDPELDPALTAAIDDFAEAVESRLAELESAGADPVGVVGDRTNVGKSLGEIATELFPEAHRADSWGYPSRSAPGSDLVELHLSARRGMR